MTDWPADRIPISAMPLPGEALESWIGAYARRLRTTTNGFLHTVGLTGTRMSWMALRINAAERAALARATGVAPEALTAMTLEPFDGLAVSILPGRRRLAGCSPAWRFGGSRSRYCPACLGQNGGRGPLFWRLPWAFCCPLHYCLLLDFCPGCRRWPDSWKARRLGPKAAGTCTRNSLEGASSRPGGREPCAYRLADAPAITLPADGLVLAAHRHIAGLLDPVPENREAVRGELRQLYALAWRIIRGLHTVADRAPEVVHTVLGECGGTLPEVTTTDMRHDAHTTAVGTALARVALHPGHADHDALFAWIVDADRSLLKKQKFNIGLLGSRWLDAGPNLTNRVLSRLDDTGVNLHTRLRYASATPRPRWPSLPAEAIEHRAAMIPAMLWPGWTMRLMPRPTNDRYLRAEAFRRGCSTFLLLPGGPPHLNYERASPLLGNTRVDRDRNSIHKRTYRTNDTTPLATTLAQLAYALDAYGSPIDYARRRTLFTPATIDLDLDAYARLCTHHGWLAGQQARLRLLRWYLLVLLTGESPPPPIDAGPTFAAHCNDLRFRIPPPLRDFLLAQARTHLARHDIDEPVTWEPPVNWVSNVTWPGPDPNDIPPADFRIALARSRTIDEATASLDMGREHIRLYCDITGITTSTPSTAIGKKAHPGKTTRPGKKTHPAAPKSRINRTEPLAPDRLRELYEDQHLSLQRIASLTGRGAPTIRTLLERDGVTLRGRRTLPPRPDITREWLQQEYTHNMRDLTNLARERGVTQHHLTLLARSWNIPIRPPGGHYNAIGHLNLRRPLSEDMRKVVMDAYALDRLRAITHVPGHPTFAAAARHHFTGTDRALRQRVIHIEKAVGFQIIDRTAKPLAPTQRGQEFLHEAAEILEAADKFKEPPGHQAHHST
ncbi:TniQ family protein [Streptomyces yunnanensis]|uniref:TniQ protein n=1 Tax=Streptomyces yunnanensis TaxID=156453 RepID=A0A9X8N8X3_9ACTN|nr:TniQ family protein [Streptomyces yunnanensis]SHN30794.1 TniQ protein [Streptomyces yunnanensis]